MSEQAQDALACMRRFQPVPWELIPDLGLYMDQVITFVCRMYRPVYGDDMKGFLTAAMINNYVKARLIPRPTGKKYSREQIALLAIIVALKQVSSMEDIRRMLKTPDDGAVEALYNAFCRRFTGVMQGMRAAPDAPSPLSPALDFAILASGYRAGSATLLKQSGADRGE